MAHPPHPRRSPRDRLGPRLSRWRLLALERRLAEAPPLVVLGRSLGALGLVAVPIWVLHFALDPNEREEPLLLAAALALSLVLLVAPAGWFSRWSVGALVMVVVAAQSARALYQQADPLQSGWFLAVTLLVSLVAAPPLAVGVALLSIVGLAIALAIDGGLDAIEASRLVTGGALAFVVAGSISYLASRRRHELRRLERRLRRARAEAARRRAESLIDQLTGLGNRRRFERDLAAALADRRAAGRVVLVLGDLDELKAINDRHGHHAGDRALQAIGEALRGALRASDGAYRIGGDEFALLAAGATEAIIARRLGARIGVELEGLGVVEASLGTAARQVGDTPADLIARADAALYRAKGEPAGAPRPAQARVQRPASRRPRSERPQSPARRPLPVDR